MKFSLRDSTIVLLLASLAVFATGCKPGDKADTAKDADKAAAADGKAADAKAIPGLETDKQKNSYVIGLDIAKSLTPIKDEIDFDTLAKAIKASMAGEKTLLDEKQATAIRESFMEHLKAKQQADMQAKAKNNLAEGGTFLATNGKKPGVQTTASGLQYQVIGMGKGVKPKASDTVRVHYAGSLLDGKTFDSSIERGEPVVFPLAQVVPGWQEGIQLMPVGSKYKFWIPSALGYGEQGTPGGPIGPNATLVFEVELLEIVKPPSK